MECGGPEPPMEKSREMLRCAVGLCQGGRGAGVRTRGVVTGVVPMCMIRVEMWMDEPRTPPVCARLGGQPAVIRHGSCPFTHPPVLAERGRSGAVAAMEFLLPAAANRESSIPCQVYTVLSI